MSTSGGGFAGSINGGEIIDCYSTGAVTGSEEAYLGGFCGGNWGDIDECFWDTETSGLDTSDGGTGMTTLEMKDWETFSDAHWDIYLDDNDRIWARSDVCNNGYPCLVNVTPSCEWITINTAMILASQNDPKLNSLKLDQKSFLMKLHDRSATLKVNRAE